MQPRPCDWLRPGASARRWGWTTRSQAAREAPNEYGIRCCLDVVVRVRRASGTGGRVVLMLVRSSILSIMPCGGDGDIPLDLGDVLTQGSHMAHDGVVGEASGWSTDAERGDDGAIGSAHRRGDVGRPRDGLAAADGVAGPLG